MKFWDSSAIAPLHVKQKATPAVRGILELDPVVVAWTLSDVEVRSALARLAREGLMKPGDLQTAVARIEAFWQTVHIVSVVDPVKARAKRILGVHGLKAADALQLGAALTAVEDDPLRCEFVCLDQRLCDAARREGFAVVP